MGVDKRIGILLAIALMERLYCLIPGLGAALCFVFVAANVHGGSSIVVRGALIALIANLGAGAYILVIGVPGLLRTRRRWFIGLCFVLAASIVFGFSLF